MIEAYSNLCQISKMMRQGENACIDRTVYSEIFRHIQRHICLPFFESRKKYPDFGEKSSDCVHLWVKFSI